MKRLVWPLLLLLGCWLAYAAAAAVWAQPLAGPAREGRLGAAAADPTADPLLNADDLTYLGAFRVPDGDTQGCDWSTGAHCFSYGAVFGYNPERHSLFIAGHPWVGGVGEVTIPPTLTLDTTATVLQDIADLADGVAVDPGETNGQGPAAALVYQARLIVAGSTYYDADGTQVKTHGVSGFDFAVADDFQGWYPFAATVTANARSLGGYMTTIPPAWRTLLGGPALTGNCCLPIISQSSAGPAVTVFDPATVGVIDPIPGETLLFYPLSAPLAPVESQNTLFNLATQMGGVAFPTGTRSILFFGRQGTGPYCYGAGEACNDPVDGSQGTHAYPYRHQVWAYDANDLLQVKQQQAAPWTVQPYAIWPLTEMNRDGSATITGAVFDPTGNRVYITEDFGDEPVVHVYEIRRRSVSAASIYLPSVQR